ncbi:MAG: TRAP transporter large permease [Devosia sp.]
MSLPFALCFLALFLLAGMGAPIALSMIGAAIVYLVVGGQDLSLAGEQIIQGLYGSFVILAVPLFIISGNLMNAGTVSERLLAFCNAIVGRFRGGLGHVDVVVNIILSGMSGSAVADAAAIGKVIIEMMTRNGRYPAGYAAAITAAAATIGPIIPPSIPMVLYSLVSDASIGYLFLGGVVPGLLMGLVLMLLNARAARKRNFPVEAPVPLREIPRITGRAFPALLMPAILLYGIYGGVTTPTEGAALAAGYALLLAGPIYRALGWRGLYDVLSSSARQTASIGIVIGGALIFNYIVASENIPAHMATYLDSLNLDPLAFLIVVNLILLFLGCLLDASTIILVVLPLFIPSCRVLGIDLVYFGVIAVVNCMIGLITPPYGVVLFVINGITGIPLSTIIREIWPFIGVLVAALILMIVFPEIVLWLPEHFGYKVTAG